VPRSLDRYNSKREFTRTPEPGPELPGERNGPLLFVIQKHAARRLHYDFRLELDGVLKSWAVPKGPSLELGEKRLAVETEDHPFEYASFEGVIPEKEYGAGNMIVWDCGVYSPDEDQEYLFADRKLAEERLREGIAAGKLSIFLRGEKVKGSFALVRTKTPKQWLLLKHRDRFAATTDVLAMNRSVLSGLVLDDVPQEPVSRGEARRLVPNGPAEPLPKKLTPMLAEQSDVRRSSEEWCYEPKLDGYRILASVENGTVRLTSRRGLDYTPFFPEITTDLAAQAVESMVLDGEIVALGDDGRPSFNALQNRAQLKTPHEISDAQRRSPVIMVCFDILHFAGVNLRNSPYVERRRYLTQCLLPSARIQLVHVSSDAEQLYQAALASGFEGIVAKRKDGTYTPGKRSSTWLKIKATQTTEFVVGGYTKGKGAREPLGALLLGYFKDDKLHYAGHVGSGLDDEIVADLQKRFAKLTRKRLPFAEKPDLHRPTTWLDPVLVVEVAFTDWTVDGMLRAPVFLRVLDDIAPRTITNGPDSASAADASDAGDGDDSVDADDGASQEGASVSDSANLDASATADAIPGGPRASARTKKAPAARSRPLTTPSSTIEHVVAQLASRETQLTLEVGAAKIRLTNLDKIYWPEDKDAKHKAVTKRDLIAYLAKVSPYMLPHLADRPLTMIRMPEGIHGQRFFQKHWEQSKPDFVRTITVFSEHKDEKHDYILANDLPTLLWLGQNGTLEFHVWHSRAHLSPDAKSQSTDYATSLESLDESVLNYPDYLVFDIDPYIYSGNEKKGEEPELNKKGFSGGRDVAFYLRALLREMSLDAIVKTSGKTGLHVFVPIERTVTFDEVRHITEIVGRHLLRQHPKLITMDWATEKRAGKIFIDHNMNVRGKTLNVAYSPRGVSGAPVSMPLTWEELEASEPMRFRIDNVLERLEKAGDRWHDALSSKQSLTRAFNSTPRT
jgi:bifunctional non-homologous end joining protein LigD